MKRISSTRAKVTQNEKPPVRPKGNSEVHVYFSDGQKLRMVVDDDVECALKNGEYLMVRTCHPSFERVGVIATEPRGRIITPKRMQDYV